VGRLNHLKNIVFVDDRLKRVRAQLLELSWKHS
jgi:hypothetical protein